MRVHVADRLSPEAVHVLEAAGFEVTERTGLAGEPLAAALRGAAAVLVRGATRMTREVVTQADGLRAVSRAGSGVDNIDLDACRERGIAVFNTPGANATSVAEHAWSLILAVQRRLVPAAVSTAAGRWDKQSFSGGEVRGKTLGVVGIGRVGSEVARLGLAFGCTVLVHDPYVAVAEALPGLTSVDLDALLARSDIVTLHVPLADQTRGLLDAQRIARMKPGAVLINCARGGLVDEAALERALVEGRLSGAGLDVFEREPPGELPLLRLPQVVATPHVAASTPEAQLRAGVQAAEAVRDFLITGRAHGRVA